MLHFCVIPPNVQKETAIFYDALIISSYHTWYFILLHFFCAFDTFSLCMKINLKLGKAEQQTIVHIKTVDKKSETNYVNWSIHA